MCTKRSVFNFLVILALLSGLGACQPAFTTTATTETSQPTPTCAPMLYGEGTLLLHIASTGGVYQMESADFNGDGLMDVVIARLRFTTANRYDLEILLNDGSGGLVRATEDIFVNTVPQTQHPVQTVLADFNGDGITDIFIADHGQDAPPYPGYPNTLVLSVPGGRLMNASENIPQQNGFSHSAAAADIDGDGDLDLYIGNVWGESMIPPQIWLNDGTGSFTIADGRLPPDQTNLNLNMYTGSGLVDVNNDDAPDLILVGNADTPESVLLLNDGSGYFTLLPGALPAKPFDPDDQGLYVASDDINGDGYRDLIISYTPGWYVGRYLQILINNGDGTFRDETDTRLPQALNEDMWIQAIALHDLDRDGDLDITTRNMTNEITKHPYYLNDGDGFYHEPDDPLPYAYSTSCFYVFIDIDGDGGLDTVSITTDDNFYLMRDLGCE